MTEPWSHFGDRLAQSVAAKDSAVCVGLDPRWEQLPGELTETVPAGDWEAKARATETYCRMVIDAVAEVAAVIKPQAAFFELLGPPGLASLHRLVDHCQRQGLLVVMDGKRGDIGSTAEGYGAAYLGPTSPWHCDSLTVNPYLGDDTLQPFVDRAHATGSGVFVLVKTSNAGSGFLQDLESDGAPVYRRVAKCVADLGRTHLGPQTGYGAIGAVVGATYPHQLAELRAAMPQSWLLIPGYGAQGGGADDVAAGFDDQGLGAIVNSSRGILFAFRRDEYRHLPWQEAIALAARHMRDDLNRVRRRGNAASAASASPATAQPERGNTDEMG
ncbi:MAG: orotidine-5'-phosphate decarboxylase [Planctomycetota bacterium]|nr:MAG: orotidine-5'-phosphate decarboxylase [Planctomycetota bacterium]